MGQGDGGPTAAGFARLKQLPATRYDKTARKLSRRCPPDRKCRVTGRPLTGSRIISNRLTSRPQTAFLKAKKRKGGRLVAAWVSDKGGVGHSGDADCMCS
jgi:hypothetical protein